MTESPSNRVHKKLSYNKCDLQLALKQIREGTLKIREAARKYNIPGGTLQDRIHGRSKSEDVRLGRMSVLSAKEEECLELWLIKLAKCGFPLKRQDVLNTVQNIVREDERQTPFVDNKPGRRWFELFMKRHPAISERIPEGISKSRAMVTEEYVRKWFHDLKTYLTSINAADILDDPTRILNGDETSFSKCPKTGKVIAPKGWKNCYDIKPGSEKETITVLLVFSAAGKMAVPMVVFPYVRPPKEVINSMPPSWFLGRSDSGWIKSDIFYEYIANGVNKWLVENEIQKPVLLFVDGHKSHMTMELSEFCDSNGIILYALPANTTHLLQPADVSVFRPLKVEWRKTVREWQRKEENYNLSLTKATFCPLLEQVLQKDMSQIIKNGFRKCGLYPFDPNAVDYSKCVFNTIENFESVYPVTKYEKDIAVHVLKQFEKSLSDRGININEIIEIIKGQDKDKENAQDLPVIIPEQKPKENSVNIISDQIIRIGDRKGYTETKIKDTDVDFATEKPRETKYILQPTNRTTNILVINNKIDDIAKKDAIINTNLHYTSLDNVKTTPSQNQATSNSFINPNENVLREYNPNYKNPIKDKDEIDIHMSDYGSLNNLQYQTDAELTLTESIINNLEIASDFSFSLPNSDTAVSEASTPSNKSFKLRSNSNTPTSGRGLSPYFTKHLFTPKRLPFSKSLKSRCKENLSSAISSSIWRDYLKEKEEAKKSLEKQKEERKQRLKLLKEAKAQKKLNLINKRGTMERLKKMKSSKKSQSTSTQSRIKCVGCEEDMISDVEENDFKNIGCDKCPRWFHLKCTVHRGRLYEEVIGEEFICHVCS